jgi:inhibitor of KinA sporulation pathway (predicted exonuclease)
LAVDLEGTCWNKRELAQTQEPITEIVEIGCCLLAPGFQKRLSVKSSFNYFVQPVLNPILSSFCKKLTTITQDNIDQSDIFPFVMNQFVSDLQQKTECPMSDIIFTSWGKWDYRQMKQDCNMHNIEFPFGGYLDLQQKFMQVRKDSRRVGLKTALERLGIEFKGRHHRAIDDAINLSKIFTKQFGSRRHYGKFYNHD